MPIEMIIDEKDRLFWADVIKKIKPIEQKNILPEISEKLPIVIHQHHHFAAKQEFSTFSKALEDAPSGIIDKATLKKFKQEQFKIEAVLDLHGKRENDAFEQVENFIVQNFYAGKRCVVIVTGKGGLHQTDDIYMPRGILKKQVPQWLNMPRIRSMILVFKNPSERLGGNGALYILLKRNRDI